MSNDLRSALRAEALKLADQFYETAMRLVAEQISGLFGGAEPRKSESVPESTTRKRIGDEDKVEALAQIVELLEQYPKGLRSEEIRAKLNMEKPLFQFATHLGKESDQLIQEGEKRATVYVLPTKPSAALAEKRVIKRKKA